MPKVNVTWYDGVDNLPELPKDYGGLEIDTTIKANKGMVRPKPNTLRPGKVIYGKDLTFKGGHTTGH